jgi:hypothetical protein
MGSVELLFAIVVTPLEVSDRNLLKSASVWSFTTLVAAFA